MFNNSHPGHQYNLTKINFVPYQNRTDIAIHKQAIRKLPTFMKIKKSREIYLYQLFFRRNPISVILTLISLTIIDYI